MREVKTNDKGLVIYEKTGTSETSYIYNDDGYIIKEIRPGYEKTYERNEKNKVVHTIDSDGDEEWMEYKDLIYPLHYKSTIGREWWQEFDNQERKISFKDSEGYTVHYEYQDDGYSKGDRYGKDYYTNGNMLIKRILEFNGNYRESDCFGCISRIMANEE